MSIYPRMFVAGLDSEVDDSALFALFDQVCDIRAATIIKHSSGPLQGSSRGFGFVELTKRE